MRGRSCSRMQSMGPALLAVAAVFCTFAVGRSQTNCADPLKPVDAYDIQPRSGAFGTRVRITGCGLSNVKEVRFVSALTVVIRMLSINSDGSLHLRTNQSNLPVGAAAVELLDERGTKVASLNSKYWEWLSNVDIRFFSPTTGGQSGTIFTIDGCFPPDCGGRSTSLTNITIGGIEAEILSQSEKMVMVRAGYSPRAIPAAQIVFIAGSGATSTGQKQWNYLEPGTIRAVTPNTGHSGTRVNISGDSLLGVRFTNTNNRETIAGNASDIKSVTLAGLKCTVLSASPNLVEVEAASGSPRTGDVRIETIAGPFVVNESSWTQLLDGIITSITPSTMQPGGDVALCGTNLLGGGSSIRTLMMAGQGSSDPSFRILNGSCIIVQTPLVPRSSPLPPSGPIVVIANTYATVYSQTGVNFTYARIDSVTPMIGRLGTYVNIVGSHLDLQTGGIDGVNISGVPAQTITSVSFQRLVVRAGDGPASGSLSLGSVKVVGRGLNTLNGMIELALTLDSSWKYIAAGSITQVTPAEGQVGTRVTIKGQFLLGLGTRITYVGIGRYTATVLSSSNTSVVISTPTPTSQNFDTLVNLVVESDSGAQTVRQGAFTFRRPGAIISISPISGQLGTRVTVRGTYLLENGSNLQSATLSGIPATVVTQTSNRVVLAAGELQTNVLQSGPIVLTSVNGALVTSTSQWTYNVPGRIASVTPSEGQFGTRVTISGSNLLGGGASVVSVVLSDIQAETVSFSSSRIVVRAVADVKNDMPGDIVITSNTGATVIRRNSWTYRPRGVITGISPTTGQRGTRVTITGNNVLAYGSSVLNATVANIPIFSVVEESSSRIVLRVGEGAQGVSGNALIYVNTEASISSQNISFTYSRPGNISSVLPSSGLEGALVVIRGDTLHGGGSSVAGVTLNGVAVSHIVYDSENEIIVAAGPTPPGAPTQAGSVEITSDTGAIVGRAQQFSYSTPVRINSISPRSGQRGTMIRIDLSVNSSTVQTVYVADTEATVTSRQERRVFIRLGRPARQGTFLGDVVVVLQSGNIARQTNGFTYISEGVIFTVSPSSGQIGTRVTITGENLLGNGTRLLSASLAGLTGQIISSSNTEAVIMVSERRLVGNVGNLTVESDTGAVVTRIDGWESIPAGVIQSVSPNVGQLGTMITVKGVRLLGGGIRLVTVRLSGIPVLSLVSFSDSVVIIQAADSGSTINQSLPVTLISDTGSRVELQQGWTYGSSGRIVSVSPSSGQYATRVTIRGSNLLGQGSSVRVTLGQTESLTVESANDTTIVVRANNTLNVTGVMENVTITANTGAFIIGIAAWMYKESGTIMSVYPPTGQQGTDVVVRGSNLFGYGTRIATATIGGTLATVRQQTNGEVLISAGISSAVRSGLDIVLEADSGAQVTAQRAFSYLTPGRVESVQPASGLGGAMVVITGSELFGYGQQLRSVTLAGVQAVFDQFSVNSSVITVTAGFSSQAVTGTIIISSSSGATVSYPNWTYISGGVISTISPSSGPPGTFATLLGSRLLSAGTAVRSVIVNGSPSISIESASNTSIRFRLGPPVSTGQSQTGVAVILNTGSTYSTSSNLFAYMVGGVVTSVSPAAGHGGATVWIRGTNLLNGGNISEVLLAGIRAQTIRTANDTVIVVTAGSGFDIIGDVVVVSTNNSLVSGLHNGWRYLPYISPSSVVPGQGQDGTRVTITAQKALLSFGVTSVLLAGIETQLVSTNTTRTFVDDRNDTVVEVIQQLALVARARPSPGSGDVVLRSNQGEELVIKGGWSYLPEQLVESLLPLTGYKGTQVTIKGRNLLAGGSRISSVSLAGVPTRVVEEKFDSQGRNVVTVEVTPDKQIMNTVSGNIVITSDNGARAVPSGRQWTFLGVQITSVGPNFGQFGTRVTISGTHLLAGSFISNPTLAGIKANVSQSTDSRVVLEANYSPPTEVGDIVLNMNTGAQVTIPRQWAYREQGNFTSVQPAFGREGTIVGITGTGLLGGGNVATDVFLDGVRVREVLASSPLYVQVVAGRGPSGGSTRPGAVRLVADTGATVTRSNSFMYVGVGTVTGLSPQSGQYGTEVTIQGSGFLSGASSLQYVKLGGVDASVISQPSDTNVTVKAGFPPRLDTFSGDIEVRSSNGGITGSNSLLQFSYVNPGQIYTLSPTSGQLGTYVRMSGERLFGGGSILRAAFLGGVSATVQLPVTNEEVTIRAGENLVPGKVNVTLVSNTGATVVKLDGWQYLPPSNITAVVPSTGRQGTKIRITGNRLTGGGSNITSVRLSGVEVMWLKMGANYIDVRAGNGSSVSSIGDVVVTSDTGAQTVGKNSFTYIRPGRIISISPALGISDQEVNITGVDLLGTGNKIVMVSFGGIDARVNRFTDTLVTVETGLNEDGERKPNVDVYLEADTGDATYAAGAWSYRESCTGNQFGLYPNNCTNCSATCRRCFDVGSNNCRECRYFTKPTNTTNGKLCVVSCPNFTDGTTCVDRCRTSQFVNESLDTANTTHRFCLPCSSQCNSNDGCTGPGPTDCRVCSNVSDEGVCKPECPIDKYTDENRFCQPCHSQCLTGLGCLGPTASDCNRCANYNVTRSSTNINVNDPSGASVLAITVCVSSCPPDYYVVGSQCFECSGQCLGGCRGSQPHLCVNCRNYREEQDGLDSCVATCNPDRGLTLFYANNNTYRCERCHQQCSFEAGCSGPKATDCNGCRNLTLYDEGNGTACVGQCPSNYYADEQFICRRCDASCTSGCNGPSASDCTSSSSSVGTFDAGTGTIAVVAAICAVLLVIVIVLFIWYCCKARRELYSLNDIPLTPATRELRYTDSQVTSPREKETAIDKRPPATLPANERVPRPLSSTPLLKQETADENYTPMGANNPFVVEAEQYTAMDGPQPIADTMYVDAEPSSASGHSRPPKKTFSSKTLPPPTTQDMYDDVEGDQLYEDIRPGMASGKKSKETARPLSHPSKSTPALVPLPKNEPPAPSLPPRDKKPQDAPFPLPSRAQPPAERPPKLGPKTGGSEPPPPPIQPRSPVSVSPLPPMLGPKRGQGSNGPSLPPRNELTPPEAEDFYEDCSNIEID